jgi:SAM-dependent methyltransferase
MIEARYDAVADFYDAGFSEPDDPVLQALLALAGPVRGLRVLDLACGHGRVSRELARRGAMVTGVDVSGALLAKARAAGPAEIAYVQADAATMSGLGSASFDAVLCNFGLSDIDDLEGALSEIGRVVQPGGFFAFSILHPCFAGSPGVAGSWPFERDYATEGFWIPGDERAALRRRVGANHRTLSTYVNGLSRNGLHVTAMSEPPAPAAWKDDPDRRGAARMPVFLVAVTRRAWPR